MVISALRRKSKFEFRTSWKKIQTLVFPCCSTHEDFSIDVSITNVGLTLTKLGPRGISFLGVRTRSNSMAFVASQLETLGMIE